MSIVSEAFRLLEEESRLAQAEIRMCTARRPLRRRRPTLRWQVIAAGNILEMEERFRSIASSFQITPRRVRGQYRIQMSERGYRCWYTIAIYVKVMRPAIAPASDRGFVNQAV